jgi:hypothetical protein
MVRIEQVLLPATMGLAAIDVAHQTTLRQWLDLALYRSCLRASVDSIWRRRGRCVILKDFGGRPFIPV